MTSEQSSSFDDKSTSRPPGVTERIAADHERIRQLFAAAVSAPAPQRGERFCELMHKLVAHEVAEEEIVFPELHHLVGGGRIADELVEEQSDAAGALFELERLEPESDAFLEKLETLHHQVLRHAEKEEREAFILLERFDPPEFLVGLGERYEKAMARAPSHPHPHQPHSEPALSLLGPVAGLYDRIRSGLKA